MGSVVQRVDNAFRRLNRYTVHSCKQNVLRYPLNTDSFGGKRYRTFEQLVQVK